MDVFHILNFYHFFPIDIGNLLTKQEEECFVVFSRRPQFIPPELLKKYPDRLKSGNGLMFGYKEKGF